ncbi:MAG: 30S ribosomal protein S12 methylthiotransferase RimO [Candidatus Omnitrophica bacterium]|nr:30S ribosomal protein S12 methylthiotransferase RimO [Candidatus Omnitrophota bacterium]
MTKIGIISLGCPRNLVDSEVMLGSLRGRGYEISEDVKESEIAIVNTCAFIEEAKTESIDIILGLIDLKKRGKIRHIVVAGCLPQRYKEELKTELAEIDGFIGTGDIGRIDSVIEEILKKGHPFLVSKSPKYIYDHLAARDFITPSHYTYIKIQEGCANRCSYCVIPDIRGDLRSRPIESIQKEAENLVKRYKVSELNIIGQDTTHYGHDLYGKQCIAELMESIARINKAGWTRLLYTHPAHYTDGFIETIRRERSICRYLDLPIQHINDKILNRMNRQVTADSIRSLIEKLRKRIPGLAIRTTVMVGFPGETDSAFAELLAFIKEAKFERLGAFIYSNEEGSRSYRFKDQVPDKLKKERFDRVMVLQQDISKENNLAVLGRTLKVLIDEKDGDNPDLYIGRTEFDAPSVDGSVFVKGEGLKAGDFADVKITDTLEYDLMGECE